MFDVTFWKNLKYLETCFIKKKEEEELTSLILNILIIILLFI